MRFPVIISIFAILVGLGTDNVFASQSQDDDEPAVTWKTFQDRNGLFSVQYPSNWTPSGIIESMKVGPIDILFLSPGSDVDSGAEVEFIQWADQSVFRTAQEALEAEISTQQNNQTLTKFEIERPIECSRYTLNGLQACSVIYEISGPDIGDLATMVVDSLATDGTEYELYYKSDFDSFEHFLPTVESMIKSFQVTGSEPATSNSSLSSGTNTTLESQAVNSASP